MWVSPEDDIEFRQVELRNLGDRTLEIELISAFEVTLSDARADEAHPAFTNLFVRAEWQPAQRRCVFERKPRLPTEPALRLAHFLADSDPQVMGVRVLTDRQRWLGRNRDASQPLADFDPWPAADVQASGHAVALDTGLDPVCAMAVRLRIAPHGQGAADLCHGGVRQRRHAARGDRQVPPAQPCAARVADVGHAGRHPPARAARQRRDLRRHPEPEHGAGAEPDAAAAGRRAHERRGGEVCDRRLLWRFGISGDRPLLLVSAGAMQGLGLLRSLAQGLRLWSWGGIACDLVVVNTEPASYQMALQRELVALRERHAAESAAQPGPRGHRACTCCAPTSCRATN